jgi:hypothetical protein
MKRTYRLALSFAMQVILAGHSHEAENGSADSGESPRVVRDIVFVQVYVIQIDLG